MPCSGHITISMGATCQARDTLMRGNAPGHPHSHTHGGLYQDLSMGAHVPWHTGHPISKTYGGLHQALGMAEAKGQWL